MILRTYFSSILLLAGVVACGGAEAPSTTQSAASAALFGAAGSTGTACVVDADCAAGFCDRTVPGGYCTQACQTQEDCASGWCDGEFCFRTCESQSDCRSAEFQCFEAAPEQGVCAFDVVAALPAEPNLGAPCRADLECAVPEGRGLQAFCAPEKDFEGRDTGYADGMCLGLNCEDDSTCGPGMRCVAGTINLCVPACTSDEECRSGYACDAPSGSCAPVAP